ncbi:hypothetical protein GPL15_16925 [Clostridium sp. MCC353]|uniref:alpha/beta hydrolase-fold protein n=1 Tax=Clostridium sp. MCC353 TaxID=2592646 RepID=UPI001C0317D6|nr:alpha/beta hydrolase-fold protein [Clostridium sp. MCC353]MBT9778186.1 hypothetical protein [Clostridium sp. MCC353]
MALMQIHFFSEALTECNSMDVILPAERWNRETYPVLWLIPPAGLDHTAWMRKTAVEELADELGILVVMPDMKLSYGTDMVHGFKYFTMLTQELPELVNEYFPADLTKQYIAGAEEGAYAALRAAFKCPENYKMAICFSCGSLTDEILSGSKKEQAANAFGTGEMENLKDTDYSLHGLLEENRDRIPKVYFAYGSQDVYVRSSELLAEKLESGGKNKIQRLEGCLTWQNWFSLLQKILSKEIK